jgi:hypothetical protein
MKTKIKIVLILCLFQLQTFPRNWDLIKAVSSDLTVIATIESGQHTDSVSIEVSIQNNSDSNYLYYSSDFSGNLNLENDELYCFITNIIAESEGTVVLHGIKPKEIIKISFSMKDFYGFKNGMGMKFKEKKYLVVEVNYICLTPEQNLKNESEVPFGRMYFLDAAKKLLLSNYR